MKNRPISYGFYEHIEKNKKTTLNFDEVYKKYYDMGFRHFKLVGREEPSFKPFEALSYYFCKPEHREFVSSSLSFFYIEYLVKSFFLGGG